MREEYDCIQLQQAEKIITANHQYSYLETGAQPLTADFRVVLADIYDVSIDYLLFCTTPGSFLLHAKSPFRLHTQSEGALFRVTVRRSRSRNRSQTLPCGPKAGRYPFEMPKPRYHALSAHTATYHQYMGR